MRNRLWVITVAFVFGMSSCNLPASRATETSIATQTSNLISTPSPRATLLNFELPTITPTSTPKIFLAAPKEQPVNCRFGPGTSYAVVGALIIGRQAEIIGRNEDSTWWYVRNPSDPSTSCWLSADFVQTVGNVQSLPVVSPSNSTVTSIQVRVDPPIMNVACEALPQVVTVGAQITTSGPVTVVWHWELSTGFVSPDKQITFEAADTKMVRDYYQVYGINDYRVQVETTLPNIATGEGSFKVVCTP